MVQSEINQSKNFKQHYIIYVRLEKGVVLSHFAKIIAMVKLWCTIVGKIDHHACPFPLVFP